MFWASRDNNLFCARAVRHLGMHGATPHPRPLSLPPPPAQAVRPFIDIVTQKKILFADRGQPEVTIMNEQFHMDKMESCIGGGFEGYAFELSKLEAECRKYDAAVEAELKQMELALKVRALTLDDAGAWW